MRKTIGILVALIQFSCAAPAPDDRVTFEIVYQPEREYLQTTERSSEMVMQYSGKEKSLKKLKEMGVRNPTIINRKSTSETVIRTGKPAGEKDFAVAVEFVKTTGSMGKPEIPDETVVQGQCQEGKQPEFDRVESPGLGRDAKKEVLQAVQNTFSQLSFPEQKLKIGEQFTMEHPRSIPMEGSTIEMVVTTHYKLMSVTNGVARFDILQEYAMNPTLRDNSFEATGSGKGQLLYDTANTICLSYNLNTGMELSKKLDSFSFVLKTKSGFSQTTSLREN